MSATKQYFAVWLHPYLSPIRQLRRYHFYTISAAVFVTFMPCYCIEIKTIWCVYVLFAYPTPTIRHFNPFAAKYPPLRLTLHIAPDWRSIWPCFKRFLLRDSLRTSQIGLLSSVFLLLTFGPAITLSLITPNFLSIHRIRRFPTDASMGPTFAARVHLP